MVHALEIIHSLLHPHGTLIDIHPAPEPPSIEVIAGRSLELAGWLIDDDGVAAYAQADEAIERAVAIGLFERERTRAFSYLTHADSLGELQAYLADEWEAATIDAQTCRRIEDLMRNPWPEKDIVLKETVTLGRLRPLARPPRLARVDA